VFMSAAVLLLFFKSCNIVLGLQLQSLQKVLRNNWKIWSFSGLKIRYVLPFCFFNYHFHFVMRFLCVFILYFYCYSCVCTPVSWKLRIC